MTDQDAAPCADAGAVGDELATDAAGDVADPELDDAGGVEGGDVDDPPPVVDRAGFESCEAALEDAVASLERVTAERDEYLAVAQRVQADFENYKRRVEAQRAEQVARAAEALVEDLLPVLDGCEAALAHGAEDVSPIWSSLFGTLERRGLVKIDQVDIVFDPNLHEAVLTEDGDGIDGQTAVAEIMRAGYQWNGRVVRPAMVKVRG